MSKKGVKMAGREGKPRREGRLARFFRETQGEIKRVSWPSWHESRNLTIIVIFVLIIMALYLGSVDWGTSELLALLVGV
jgi:preprotein translocase subunit SecE